MLLPFFKFFDEVPPARPVDSQPHAEPEVIQDLPESSKKDKHVASSSTIETDWITFAESSTAHQFPEMSEKDKRVFSTLTEVTVSGETLNNSERDSHVIQPAKWPQQPESLGGSFIYEFGLTLYDVFLCMLPFCLLVKAGLCIRAAKMDGGLNPSTIDYAHLLTKELIKFNEQLVTAFTIIFVTIMTTAIRRYALWKAQRGAYVSDLEQMQGSISLPSTLKMVVVLRKFTFFSFGLFAVWSFYYLGSQATTREYTFVISNDTTPVRVGYPIWAQYPFDFGVRTEGAESVVGLINADLLTMLEIGDTSEASGDRSIDYQGNVVWPTMKWQYVTTGDNGVKDLPVAIVRPDSEKYNWMDVHTAYEDYNALSGRRWAVWGEDIYNTVKNPSWGEHKHWEWNLHKFTGSPKLKTSYFDIDCYDVVIHYNDLSMPEGTHETMRTSLNYTLPSNETSVDERMKFDIWYRWDNSTYDTIDTIKGWVPPVIDGVEQGTLQITCELIQPELEFELSCNGLRCVPHKARYLKLSDEDLFKTPFSNRTWGYGFFDNLLWASGEPTEERAYETRTQASMQTASTILSFLSNQEPSSDQDTYADIESALSSYSFIVQQLFNSYSNIAYNRYDYTTPDTEPQDYFRFTFNTALYWPHYKLHIPWLTIDFVSCTILLVAALLSFWLRKNTLAPEIFGCVSEVTRDNKHIPLADGGSGLSGYDRARRMKDVKIKIGDVSTDPEVGRIGIVVADQNVPSLSKAKRYL